MPPISYLFASRLVLGGICDNEDHCWIIPTAQWKPTSLSSPKDEMGFRACVRKIAYDSSGLTTCPYAEPVRVNSKAISCAHSLRRLKFKDRTVDPRIQIQTLTGAIEYKVYTNCCNVGTLRTSKSTTRQMHPLDVAKKESHGWVP